METVLVVMVRGASVTTQQEALVPKETAQSSAVVCVYVARKCVLCELH